MPGLLDPTVVNPIASSQGSLLDAFVPQAVAKLQALQQQAAPGPAQPGVASAGSGQAAGAAPTIDPLQLAQTAGVTADQNAYGKNLAALGYGAGFPSFQDPRLIADQLATQAQAGYPGADDAFRKYVFGGGGGSWGSGGGGGGDIGPAGSDVSSGPGSW